MLLSQSPQARCYTQVFMLHPAKQQALSCSSFSLRYISFHCCWTQGSIALSCTPHFWRLASKCHSRGWSLGRTICCLFQTLIKWWKIKIQMITIFFIVLLTFFYTSKILYIPQMILPLLFIYFSTYVFGIICDLIPLFLAWLWLHFHISSNSNAFLVSLHATFLIRPTTPKFFPYLGWRLDLGTAKKKLQIKKQIVPATPKK
jgi:hypothetical protein